MRETDQPTDLQGLLVEARLYAMDYANLYSYCPKGVVFKLIQGRYNVLHSSDTILFDKHVSPYPTTRFYSFSSQIFINDSYFKIEDVEKFFLALRFYFLLPKLGDCKPVDFARKVSEYISSSCGTIGLSKI